MTACCHPVQETEVWHFSQHHYPTASLSQLASTSQTNWISLPDTFADEYSILLWLTFQSFSIFCFVRQPRWIAPEPASGKHMQARWMDFLWHNISQKMLRAVKYTNHRKWFSILIITVIATVSLSVSIYSASTWILCWFLFPKLEMEPVGAEVFIFL